MRRLITDALNLYMVSVCGGYVFKYDGENWVKSRVEKIRATTFWHSRTGNTCVHRDYIYYTLRDGKSYRFNLSKYQTEEIKCFK